MISFRDILSYLVKLKVDAIITVSIDNKYCKAKIINRRNIICKITIEIFSNESSFKTKLIANKELSIYKKDNITFNIDEIINDFHIISNICSLLANHNINHNLSKIVGQYID